MSLVNDVLKDLQKRQVAAGHPLAGLEPANAVRRRVPWLTAVIASLVVVTGLTAWRMDASVSAAAPGVAEAVAPLAVTNPATAVPRRRCRRAQKDRP